MRKEFNITGLCVPDRRYMVDLSRHLEQIIYLICLFIMHNTGIDWDAFFNILTKFFQHADNPKNYNQEMLDSGIEDIGGYLL